MNIISKRSVLNGVKMSIFEIKRKQRVMKQIRMIHSQEGDNFESFNEKYEKFFRNVEDLFELQRGLNNAFAYDFVPMPSVIEEALRAARRVNDFPTAVRIFEGIKHKVNNKKEYQQYLDELKSVREELGIPLKEELV
ncbi:hypothetical protein T552_00995 [Pneumocystis carinii B80]|uniref:Cytochrome c oxidase subunit 6, mitochondrial n=1 Tax=Pneumocystis carinii (strain B80) TaxID=1408658 RepID=A0A0W4ZN40_PNEC8|nr:hypothetical protein T552_00995 [Pneumocystis carinii B80]KTW29790.1 hypothetical protein T552_00995 [Pneumocystis carinii B80]